MKINRSGGQSGRKIIVETNMLRINFSEKFETKIIHYDVVIVPDKPKCFLRLVFDEFRKIHCPKRYPAFDGRKNAYSGNELPFGNESVSNRLIMCFYYYVHNFFIFVSYMFNIYLL